MLPKIETIPGAKKFHYHMNSKDELMKEAIKMVVPSDKYRFTETGFSFSKRFLYSITQLCLQRYGAYRLDNEMYTSEENVDGAKAYGKMQEAPRRPDYDTLFLTADAPVEIVKAVYKKLSFMYHPDHGGDEEKLKEINAAYERIKAQRGIK